MFLEHAVALLVGQDDPTRSPQSKPPANSGSRTTITSNKRAADGLLVLWQPDVIVVVVVVVRAAVDAGALACEILSLVSTGW